MWRNSAIFHREVLIGSITSLFGSCYTRLMAMSGFHEEGGPIIGSYEQAKYIVAGQLSWSYSSVGSGFQMFMTTLCLVTKHHVQDFGATKQAVQKYRAFCKSPYSSLCVDRAAWFLAFVDNVTFVHHTYVSMPKRSKERKSLLGPIGCLVYWVDSRIQRVLFAQPNSSLPVVGNPTSVKPIERPISYISYE